MAHHGLIVEVVSNLHGTLLDHHDNNLQHQTILVGVDSTPIAPTLTCVLLRQCINCCHVENKWRPREPQQLQTRPIHWHGSTGVRIPAHPGAPTENSTAVPVHTGGREICRNFRHKGHCRFGADCKFEHAADKPMVMLSQVAEAHIGELQQLLMEHMPESERALTHMSPDLYSIYEEGLATVGKPEHRETIKDMQQVFMTVIADRPQVNTNVQPVYDPVGNWSLDYAP